MFDRPSQMEPMLPTSAHADLEALVLELIRDAACLTRLLRTQTRSDVVELLRSTNSYYSNLIEGHGTRPIDIERALRGDYSHDHKRRVLQQESRAHVEVEREIDSKLASAPTIDVVADDFLCWTHERFYESVPEELRLVEHDGKQLRVIPGLFRKTEVRVGRHLAPLHQHLGAFMKRFHEAYASRTLSPVDQVIAAAASHHRLAWIHPFLDGNGRVVRLFTHAFMKRLRLDGQGLWSVSRGLARRREDYLRLLEEADEPRRGDLDGRGSLSDRGLAEFCRFFLEVCLDQVRFMRDLLDFDGLERRILRYGELAVTRDELPREAGPLLRLILLCGEVPRGDAAQMAGKSTRTGERIVAALIKRGLLQSNTERGPLRLAFPMFVVPYYFPKLFPEAVEADMITTETGR